MKKPRAPIKAQGAAGLGAGQSDSLQEGSKAQGLECAKQDACGKVGVPAYQVQLRRPLRDTFAMNHADFYRECISMVDESCHAPRVTVIENAGEVSVEILGSLPLELRCGLERVYAWWEPPRRGWTPWSGVRIVWYSDVSGYGPRYAFGNLGALLDLIEERRLMLRGGRA